MSQIHTFWLLHRPLSVDDIVRIKALIPDSVNFDYVDEGEFEINVENSSSTIVAKQNDDIFKLKSSSNPAVNSVLFFEFTDGELRQKLNRKKGYRHSSDSGTLLILTEFLLIERILNSQSSIQGQLCDLLTSETTNLGRLWILISNPVPVMYIEFILQFMADTRRNWVPGLDWAKYPLNTFQRIRPMPSRFYP